jgi:carboxyl-terminal processing protease
VNDDVVQAFRKYLESQKIDYTENDLQENPEWLKSQIRSELFIAEFGQEEGMRVRAEADPQILKALELLPRARELAEGAKKVIAERNGARGIPNP